MAARLRLFTIYFAITTVAIIVIGYPQNILAQFL
jgi:hypothetical protein